MSIPGPRSYLVTLNAGVAPRPDSILGRFVYEHPIYDTAAMQAQR